MSWEITGWFFTNPMNFYKVLLSLSHPRRWSFLCNMNYDSISNIPQACKAGSYTELCNQTLTLIKYCWILLYYKLTSNKNRNMEQNSGTTLLKTKVRHMPWFARNIICWEWKSLSSMLLWKVQEEHWQSCSHWPKTSELWACVLQTWTARWRETPKRRVDGQTPQRN